MALERKLVEDLVAQAIGRGNELTLDSRQRDLTQFATFLVASVIYALGEIDDDLWSMIGKINQEVADHALILGEVTDDVSSMELSEVPRMTAERVRERINDQLQNAEDKLRSEYLTDADRATCSIAFMLGKALVLQLRELNDDECHLINAIGAGSAQLGSLLQSLK